MPYKAEMQRLAAKRLSLDVIPWSHLALRLWKGVQPQWGGERTSEALPSQVPHREIPLVFPGPCSQTGGLLALPFWPDGGKTPIG